MAAELLQFLPLALSGISSVAGAFRGPPEINTEEIEQMIDAQITRAKSEALSRVTGDVRARLGSQGLGGSGVIDSVIRDEQSRIEQLFEDQRQKSLSDLSKFKLGAEIGFEQDRQGRMDSFFSGLSNLGTNIFAFNNPQLFNPFQQNSMQAPGFNSNNTDASLFGLDFNTQIG